MINQLKEHRKQLGLTQSELANLVFVSPRTIISLEKGQYKPSIMLAYRLACIFEMSIEELFCLKENKHMEDARLEDL